MPFETNPTSEHIPWNKDKLIGQNLHFNLSKSGRYARHYNSMAALEISLCST